MGYDNMFDGLSINRSRYEMKGKEKGEKEKKLNMGVL